MCLSNDIHSLSFTLCLNRSELTNVIGENDEDKAKKVQCMPDDAMKNEVFIASIFCAVVQLFISFLLLFNSIQAMRNDEG